MPDGCTVLVPVPPDTDTVVAALRHDPPSVRYHSSPEAVIDGSTENSNDTALPGL